MVHILIIKEEFLTVTPLPGKVITLEMVVCPPTSHFLSRIRLLVRIIHLTPSVCPHDGTEQYRVVNPPSCPLLATLVHLEPQWMISGFVKYLTISCVNVGECIGQRDEGKKEITKGRRVEERAPSITGEEV